MEREKIKNIIEKAKAHFIKSETWTIESGERLEVGMCFYLCLEIYGIDAYFAYSSEYVKEYIPEFKKEFFEHTLQNDIYTEYCSFWFPNRGKEAIEYRVQAFDKLLKVYSD
jgi:hypothetical protein